MAKGSGTTKSVGSGAASAPRTTAQASAPSFPKMSASSMVNDIGETPTVSRIANYFKKNGYEVETYDENQSRVYSPSGAVMVSFKDNDVKGSSDWYEMSATVYRVDLNDGNLNHHKYKEAEFPLRSGTWNKMPNIQKGNLQSLLDNVAKLDKKYGK